MRSLRLRQNATNVELIIDGRLVATLPYQKALEVAAGMHYVSKQAEEYAAAANGSLIMDQAIVMRAGAPFSLSGNPKVNEAARTEAQWGNIRRYMPAPSIASGEKFGTPTIIRHSPKQGGR